MILGKVAIDKLSKTSVAVFGIGGVGGSAAEALARSGIGRIALCDDDTVCLTNINRQVIATHKTVGRDKTDVMAERIKEINPAATVEMINCFYGTETAGDIDLSAYDYIIDAVDTVTAKLLLVEGARDAGVPIISCMGTGNKLDPTRFEVTDIYKTSVCPLAKVMRKELKARGITSLKVVYSQEIPITPVEEDHNSCKFNCICPPESARHCEKKRQNPGSVSFVPPVAGMILAGEVIKDLIFNHPDSISP
ncbi:MAG: tRNA threonylcarbamoyladenosine dehydratase [Defluviitaleaceae bacterium]|nr:tRNA threonylcarbamoyladenosine dehydratase [Defluviitaleaceae bacterium]